MEEHGTRSRDDALVFLSFLGQADCKNIELRHELQSLARDFDVVLEFNSNSSYIRDGGDLETDGHSASNIRELLGELEPPGDLQEPGNQIDAVVLGELTAELKIIADQFECSVLAQATGSLAKKLGNSAIQMWKAHLTLEVEWVVKHSLALDLPQERVMMALSFTLVKGVCERMPQLLRTLFTTTMQYLQ